MTESTWLANRADSMKTVIGLLITTLTVAVLPESAQAQSACATPFFKLLNDPLRNFCRQQGISLHKVTALDPSYTCQGSEWAEARKNIDWVWFEDAGARQSYKQAMDEFNRTNCIAANLSWDRPLFAILYAQRHNGRAQCIIWDCRVNFGGAAGYFNEVKDAGKLP